MAMKEAQTQERRSQAVRGYSLSNEGVLIDGLISDP